MSNNKIINTMKRVMDIKSYVSNVTALIWHYIKHTAFYPSNSKLVVQKELGETVIDDPTVCRECEFYDISSFIKKDERGLLAPNVIAIQNLAYKIMANK
nr:hypothetical protein [Prevotella sp.]